MSIIVFSCSNDTTIKLWSLDGIDKQQKNIGSKVNLNEDYDYVHAIAYSAKA